MADDITTRNGCPGAVIGGLDRDKSAILRELSVSGPGVTTIVAALGSADKHRHDS
ncbi:MAG TPA: hypothetical protein VFZ97_11105 [Acidimicrobiales bacterium]